MKKIFKIVLFFLFLNISYTQAFEKRVTGYTDDGIEAWFTFSYSPSDIFSLSFAGSGEAAGIWITKGKILDPNNTLCLLLTNNFKEISSNVYSTIIHNMVKCETYEVKALVYVDFERPMGRGSPTTEAIVPVDFPDYHEWIYYDKNNTVQGQVLSEICD